ncbi:Uncharacterised protein [Vibrio cholerae]|nr:Uncharacterised protein [Vibrio cholerae]
MLISHAATLLLLCIKTCPFHIIHDSGRNGAEFFARTARRR